MGSLNDPLTYQRGLVYVAQINGRKLGLFRIPTTIFYCCQYTSMYIVCCTIVVHFYVKFSCHLCKEKCNFAILWQTFQQMSKLSSARGGGWSQIGQFSRCGRSDWCASEDNGRIEKRFLWYMLNVKGLSRFVRMIRVSRNSLLLQLIISIKVPDSTRHIRYAPQINL